MENGLIKYLCSRGQAYALRNFDVNTQRYTKGYKIRPNLAVVNSVHTLNPTTD
jgi:hypothetical protein